MIFSYFLVVDVVSEDPIYEFRETDIQASNEIKKIIKYIK